MNFKLEDGLFVDPKEFFYKTKEAVLKVNRVVLDNCRCNLVSKIIGYDFRKLLDAMLEEVEAKREDEYIMIFKTEKGFLVHQEIFNEFENQEMVNEWIVAC